MSVRDYCFTILQVSWGFILFCMITVSDFSCSYPTTEDQLFGAEVQHTQTVLSDHILTSRGMGTAIAFGLAIVARLQGQESADRLGAAIVYNQ